MRKASLLIILIVVLSIEKGNAQEIAIPQYDTTTSLVRGCYVSVQEFLTNSPSLVDSFDVTKYYRHQENWSNTESHTPRYAGRKKKVKDIWGFCDGENIFVFHQIEYFQIQRDSIGYFFKGYQVIDYSAANIAYVFGGLITGAIAQQAILDKCKRSKIKYRIDKHTGWPIHPNPKFNYGMPTETVVIYRNDKNESERAISVLVNDSIELKLVPNAFHSLKLLSGTPEVEVCYGKDNNECATFQLDLDGIDYFNLAVPEDTGVPILSHVSESEGDYYSYKAQKAQNKRLKRMRKRKKGSR